jgi:hypothetical protein
VTHILGHDDPKIAECLEKLRRFASCFDLDAARWLMANDNLVWRVLTSHLDQMTSAERMNVYSILFGFFRRHYESVVRLRLQVEQDPECRARLAMIEELNREKLGKPYLPVTDEDLIAGSEKNLLHPDLSVRYIGALALWILTKDASKVLPTLLAIVKDRGANVRLEAATLLAEVQPLDHESMHILHKIASDPKDPAHTVVKDALRLHMSPG